MATEISSDAQKVLEGASQQAVDYAMQNAPGNKLTSGEATRLLAKFNTSGAYSGQNVVNAMTGATPTYDYNDPYGAYANIGERLGLTAATEESQAASRALKEFQTGTQAQINALRANRDLSTGLEAGFEAQRTREATQQEQVLANELALREQARMALEGKVEREYGIYQSERDKREELLLQAIQAGAKNVNIGMSTSELTKAYTKATNERAKEEEKKAYKNSLKQQLISMGKSTSGNTKELEKRLKKAAKSDSEYKQLIQSLDIEAKQLSIAKARQSLSGGGKAGTEDKEIQNFYADAQGLRTQMAAGNSNWSYAWNLLRQKYPQASIEVIDQTLGLDYRQQYD